MAQQRQGYTPKDEKRYPDSIKTFNGPMVRITSMDDNAKIRLTKDVEIRVKDIPINAVLLTCGDIVRGIALRKGNVVFCEKHGEDVFVVGDA